MAVVEADLRKPHRIERIGESGSVRLEGDELAIIGAIDLASSPADDDNGVRLVCLDVSYKQTSDGRFGPYDIYGEGINSTFNSPYLLISKNEDNDLENIHIVEFEKGEILELGRTKKSVHRVVSEHLGYRENPLISRKHALLYIDENGNLVVKDQGSLNGTTTRAAVDLLGDPDGEFLYTAELEDHLKDADRGHLLKPQGEGEGWGHGEFAGRPIIARDTPINGGVYPVVSHRRGEALVVDDKKYPYELDETYAKLLNKIRRLDPNSLALDALSKARKGDIENERLVLEELHNLVYDTLRYDLEATNKLAQNFEKIAINNYIYEGVGVCRTQAILSAYLIERLIDNGYLHGRVSVDRNLRHNVAGGHAWARYTDQNGQVWIIDPAQDYIGKLESGTPTNGRWDYRRTEDLVKFLLEPDNLIPSGETDRFT